MIECAPWSREAKPHPELIPDPSLLNPERRSFDTNMVRRVARSPARYTGAFPRARPYPHRSG